MSQARVLMFTLAAAIAAGGCAKKNKVNVSETEQPAAVSARDSDSGNASGLVTVNFAYDSHLLGAEAKARLKRNAALLRKEKRLRIQIEGHADERGGIQYNLALGERRASSVRKYLRDLGIANERMQIVSYGKERLLDAGDSERAHSRNRRANFVIVQEKM